MKKFNYVQFGYIIISLMAFSYVFIRAINVGITYDEAWTLKDFVPCKVINILNYSPCDANNHILNTLLIKLFFLFGNHSLFVARLPNVFAFVLYLYFGSKITYNFLTPLTGICCFLLLLLNPFLLDFFSIARGYGLSLSFLIMSLYFMINYFKSCKSIEAFCAICFGALAVLSNFSLLNYWIILLFIINIVSLYYKKSFNIKKTFLYSLLVLIVLTVIIYEPIRKLIINGSLYYGGKTGFYSDTLRSLAKYTFYSPNSNSVILFTLNVFIFILFITVLVSFFFEHKLLSSKNMFISITILCILSIILQHYLLGTLYLIDRTALFFYPLLIFCFCFSVNNFSNKWYSKIIVISVITCGFNFFNHANFYKTALWYFDGHSSEILSRFNEEGKLENKKLKIGFTWVLNSSFRYYVELNKYSFVELVMDNWDDDHILHEFNYYVYLSQSADQQKMHLLNKKIDKQYQDEGMVIYKIIKK